MSDEYTADLNPDWIPDREQSSPHFADIPENHPFPISALPIEAQELTREVSRWAQVDENLAAIQVLACISASLGKGAVSIDNGRKTWANLWILGVAATGTGKSESSRPIFAPLREIQAEVRTHWEEFTKPTAMAKVRGARISITGIEAKIKKLKNDREELEALIAGEELTLNKWLPETRPPKLIVEDTTPEAMADAFLSADETLFSYSTDAGKVLSNLHGRYSSNTSVGQVKEDTLLLKAYSVESYAVDRKGGGETLLKQPWIALLWLVQPGKLPLLFDQEALSDGGFMPRVMPYLSLKLLPLLEIQPPIDPGITDRWETLIRSLYYDLRASSKLKGQSVEFNLSNALAQRILDWGNEKRRRVNNGELSDVSGYVTRWVEWAKRIAVNLQACALIHGDTSGEISSETVEKAIQIAEWFSIEQLRILHGGRVRKRDEELKRLQTRAEKLIEILEGKWGRVTVAELKRNHGYEKVEVQKIIKTWPLQFELIADANDGRVGRPSDGTVQLRTA